MRGRVEDPPLCAPGVYVRQARCAFVGFYQAQVDREQALRGGRSLRPVVSATTNTLRELPAVAGRLQGRGRAACAMAGGARHRQAGIHRSTRDSHRLKAGEWRNAQHLHDVDRLEAELLAKGRHRDPRRDPTAHRGYPRFTGFRMPDLTAAWAAAAPWAFLAPCPPGCRSCGAWAGHFSAPRNGAHSSMMLLRALLFRRSRWARCRRSRCLFTFSPRFAVDGTIAMPATRSVVRRRSSTASFGECFLALGGHLRPQREGR